MERRKLLGLGLAGLSTPLFFPNTVLAGKNPLHSKLAGGVFYTLDNPGRWAKKAKGHAPIVEKHGKDVKMTTAHEMNGFVHYIIKHQILNANFEFVEEKFFNPEKDSPITEHSLKGFGGGVAYAVSMCNKHDVWVTPIKL